MAGGKLTPRQKMINLMYLVFIAMQALNMSKEVLSAFGLMNERLIESNKAIADRNQSFLSGLKDKASENQKQYGELAAKAAKIDVLASDFTAYIDDVRTKLLKGVKDPQDYETMDKSANADNLFFVGGDKYSKDGQEFVDKMNAFRTEVIAILGNDYKDVQADIEKKFSTGENGKVKDREGVSRNWLEYNYKGFPLVASLTKLTQIQSDIKTIESEILGKMLQGNLAAQVSMTNYKAIVVLDKNAFYQGEQVTGKVVLGRYDENTVPTSVSVNGGSATIENGQAILKLAAGSVGEHDIKGKFVFTENGEEVPIDIDGKYVVVPKPNSANISADKMNVVYIGVDNPMTISFAGISDNNVTASAPGLSSKGNGKYTWRPTGGGEAIVNVTGKLPDGTSVSDKKAFRVKTIPAPMASLRGQQGGAKGSKENLINSPVKVVFNDFDFEVKTTVVQFEVKADGSSIVVCQGDRFSPQAVAAINKVPKGGSVIISNVKTRIEGTNIPVKDSTPFIWEVQ